MRTLAQSLVDNSNAIAKLNDLASVTCASLVVSSLLADALRRQPQRGRV